MLKNSIRYLEFLKKENERCLYDTHEITVTRDIFNRLKNKRVEIKSVYTYHRYTGVLVAYRLNTNKFALNNIYDVITDSNLKSRFFNANNYVIVKLL